MRTCKRCKEVKPLTDFSKTRKNSIYRKHTCKSCRNKDINKYRRRTVYGASEEWYEDTLVEQDYRCAGCETHQKDLDKALCVDHCHTTGKPRGLLCWPCNLSLGHADDNPDTLRRLAKYAEETRQT